MNLEYDSPLSAVSTNFFRVCYAGPAPGWDERPDLRNKEQLVLGAVHQTNKNKQEAPMQNPASTPTVKETDVNSIHTKNPAAQSGQSVQGSAIPDTLFTKTVESTDADRNAKMAKPRDANDHMGEEGELNK